MRKNRSPRKASLTAPKQNPVVCTDWPGMEGEGIVQYINGLPYTARMLERRKERLDERQRMAAGNG